MGSYPQNSLIISILFADKISGRRGLKKDVNTFFLWINVELKVLSASINQVRCMWFIYKVGPTTWYITTVYKRERANEWMAVMYPCYKKCNTIIPACNICPFEDANSWNSIRFNRLFPFFCESEGLQLLKGWRQIPSYQQCHWTMVHLVKCPKAFETHLPILSSSSSSIIHVWHPTLILSLEGRGVHGPAQFEKHKLIWASNMSVQARTFSQSAGQATFFFTCSGFLSLVWAFYRLLGIG